MKKATILTLLGGIALGCMAQLMSPGQKLSYVERIIEQRYVGDIDTTAVVDEAIRAMLRVLDPHSSYSTPDETRQLTEPLQGNFSGIGIQFSMLNDTLYVVQTTNGGPSEQVGLLAGDRILTANDSVMSGVKRNNSDIQRILRGPKGTPVDVTVLRHGENAPLEFHIIRDDIPIYSVDAAYMATPTTGYIRISRFAEDTPNEVRRAMRTLTSQGMQDLIIDLQDNGGGYLGSATELADYFLEQGSPIVSTKGDRVAPTHYEARGGTLFPENGRVVVLMNQYSASASEIFAGAMQDNDRGVVIGRRSFGKGLVQRPFPFPDGSMVRLTVSRYYTPSGRCIQKPYTSGDDEAYAQDLNERFNSGEYFSADSIVFSDTTNYYTLRLHRPVRGGGGIMPDVFVALDTMAYTPHYRGLRAKGIIKDYPVSYLDTHREEVERLYRTEDDFVRGFTVTDEMIEEINNMGAEKGIEIPEEGITDAEREMIATVIKAIIGRDLFEQSTYFRIYNDLDPVYKEALKILDGEPSAYTSILQP